MVVTSGATGSAEEGLRYLGSRGFGGRPPSLVQRRSSKAAARLHDPRRGIEGRHRARMPKEECAGRLRVLNYFHKTWDSRIMTPQLRKASLANLLFCVGALVGSLRVSPRSSYVFIVYRPVLSLYWL